MYAPLTPDEVYGVLQVAILVQAAHDRPDQAELMQAAMDHAGLQHMAEVSPYGLAWLSLPEGGV